MIYIDLFLAIFLIYPLGRYLFIPTFRKKSIVLTYKELALIILPIVVIALSNLLSFSTVIITLVLLLIILLVMILNLWFIFGSAKEDLMSSISKTVIGMSLESKVIDNRISVPMLGLMINSNSMLGIYFLRFNSTTKSEKLNLFKTATRKFITA